MFILLFNFIIIKICVLNTILNNKNNIIINLQMKNVILIKLLTNKWTLIKISKIENWKKTIINKKLRKNKTNA